MLKQRKKHLNWILLYLPSFKKSFLSFNQNWVLTIKSFKGLISSLSGWLYWPLRYVHGFYNYCALNTFFLPKDLFSSVKFSSVPQLSPTLCNPMNHSTSGLPVHHQLPEFTQTHAHQVGDAIQPSHPLSSPSLPDPNPSQHHGLLQWVSSSHQVAKVLEFQHQFFQWTFRTDFL